MIVLADTSVWVGHFRKNDRTLAELLSQASVLMHPFVWGELACGNLKNREVILQQLQMLPSAIPATDEETLRTINVWKLWGHGIGWIDAHLLASALLSNCHLWTLDERLKRTAAASGVKLYQDD